MAKKTRPDAYPKSGPSRSQGHMPPMTPWQEEFQRHCQEVGDPLSQRGREVSADAPAWCLGPSRPRRRVERDDPDADPDR